MSGTKMIFRKFCPQNIYNMNAFEHKCQKVQQEGPSCKNATLRNIAGPKTEKGQHHNLPWEKLPQIHVPYVYFGVVVLIWYAFENASSKGFEKSKEKEKRILWMGKKMGRPASGPLAVLRPTGLNPAPTVTLVTDLRAQCQSHRKETKNGGFICLC